MMQKVQRKLRRCYLGWTILQRSCELVPLARELADPEIISLLNAVAQRAAKHVGASGSLVKRMQSVSARRSRASVQ